MRKKPKFNARSLAFAACLVASGVTTMAFAQCQQPPQPRLATSSLVIETLRGITEFTVELAVTTKQKECGLMRRPRLKPFQGMLFQQSPPAQAYFWMKNTPAPLDMVFIDESGRVIHIVEHATPYSTTARGTDLPTAGILELSAGTANRLAIELGDQVTHAWFK